MKPTTFEDWRDTALWAAIAIAALIIGFALGWSWRDRPGALTNVSLLNVMTAFGTVGAVVAALAVPMWQNFDRLREQKLALMMRNWTTAHIVYQIAGRASELLTKWAAMERPSSSEFAALHTRLNTIQDRVDGVFEVSIISALASVVSNLEGITKKCENSALINATRAKASPVPTLIVQHITDDQFSDYLNEVEKLKRQCEDWMLRIRADADRVKVHIPGFVYGSGKAEMTMAGSAAGVVRKEEEEF